MYDNMHLFAFAYSIEESVWKGVHVGSPAGIYTPLLSLAY
jgi:hypothetical protein